MQTRGGSFEPDLRAPAAAKNVSLHGKLLQPVRRAIPSFNSATLARRTGTLFPLSCAVGPAGLRRRWFRHFFRLLTTTALCLGLQTGARAQDRWYLVKSGEAVARIEYGKEDAAAATRLQRRVREWTGTSLQIANAGETVEPAKSTTILIGSPSSNPSVARRLEHGKMEQLLGPEGLLIRTVSGGDGRAVLLAGSTRLGAIYAVGEFLNWHLRIDGKDAWVESTDLTLRPALSKRLFWSSVGGANWPADFEQLHAKQDPAALATAIQDEKSYLDHTRWMIDFMAEHKFNGTIFWGFVGATTGGVESARKMSRYAKDNGIRVLPLIGTGIYNGFYNGESDYNITTWAKKHPEARCEKLDGTPYDQSIAACHPRSIEFLRKGAEWLFTTFPDIGGVNLENGDWISCWNSECAAAKAKPENDPNFYWDMMASQRDVIEIGLKHQPDAWMTFATYTPFTEQLIRRDLAAAMKQKLAKEIVYPPRFLDQVDPRSIAQWTVSGMNGEAIWPSTAKPPPGRLKHHIAFTHQNSYYGQKIDPARWWAEPNATHDEGSPVLFFQIPQAIKTGFEGFVVKGFVGDASPANELFYLAAEELLWNPQSTPERFAQTRLSVAYGGAERASTFLRILRDTTRDGESIRANKREAENQAAATGNDPRVARRWRNLADEMGRRSRIPAPATSESK